MQWIRNIQPKPAAWPPPRAEASVAEALRYARRRDPFGDIIQTAFAMLSMFLLPLGSSPKEIVWIALAICTVLRFPFIWRCYTVLLRDPLAWVLLAWSGWRALSMLWSADALCGFDEFASFRALLLPLALWPVLDRIPWLIGAFLAGVFAQNGVQLAQQLHWFGLHPAFNGRLRGFIHPIHTGATCAAAAAWHLAALLRVPHRRALAVVSGAGLAAAVAGLIASGSRGPWLAAAIMIPVQVIVTGIRRPRSRRAAAVAAILGLLAAAAAWPLAGDFVRLRVGQAMSNLDQAWSPQPDFNTDVGQRLSRWNAAMQVFAKRPLAGTGGGGYAAAIDELGYGALAAHQDHAHSLYLHEAASTGLIGAALMLGAFAMVLRRLWAGTADHPYLDGTIFVLLGWLIGSVFDCYHLNGTMFGLFGFMAALCLKHAGASARQ